MIEERLKLLPDAAKRDRRFARWKDGTVAALYNIGAHNLGAQVSSAHGVGFETYGRSLTAFHQSREPHVAVAIECHVLLSDALEDIEKDPASILNKPPRKVAPVPPPEPSAIDTLRRLASRFGVVAKELARTYQRTRLGFVVQDEADAQHLFAALLRLYFEDVRREEPTPSHAGGSSKIDYFLLDKAIAVELKHTRESLPDRAVGGELIIDIERYRQHAQCRTLFCLVYDPGHLLSNPTGLQHDLTKTHPDGFAVVVVVSH